MTKSSTGVIAAAVAVAGMAGSAAARDQIQIVGSSTVFPCAQAVAEQFASTTEFPFPVIESTGSGGRMKIFCQGIGEARPDITEVLIGYDGITLSVSRDTEHDWDLTEAQLYQALAKEVPVDGAFVANPYSMWSDIGSSLPAVEILVYGPPPTSGTRDAFVELAMVDGCMELEAVEANGEEWAEENCGVMRTDGPFIEAGENDNLIVQRLQNDANALGIFGYFFLFENQDSLMGIAVNGTKPNTDTIADGSYDIARPLYFYIKNAHRGVIPGLEEFIAEFVANDTAGQGGYLSKRGLTPLSEDRLQDVQERAMSGASMEAAGS